MSDSSADRQRQIAELAVELGDLSKSDLQEAERLLAEANGDTTLHQILVERGFIRAEALDELSQQFETESIDGLNDEADGSGDPLFANLGQALDRIDETESKGSSDAEPSPPVDEFGATMTAYGDSSGRFAIIREHAQGGLGEVLLAEDQHLRRQVAIKQIREEWADHPHAQERFLQEAEITGRLEHPGVVPVHALGSRPDGRPYYAMRFIKGDSLEDALQRFHQQFSEDDESTERSLELRHLLTRFLDVCNTMSYAHSRGIVHRDLKPANIMLGKYGETLVVDWGLAKAVGETEIRSTKADSLITPGSGSGSSPTQYGSAVGTPQYMSPEQAMGRVDRIGPSSDIYCLGATLYHVLTGKPPVVDDSLERILDRVEHGDVKPAHEINPSVPEPLSAICKKAMSVRSAERYGTASELAADIDRWLADEPVSVYEEPLMARLGRWTRRHRVLATSTGLAVVLLGLAAISGSAIWNHFHEQRLRQDLEIARRAQERLAEVTASTEAAEQLANEELQAGRFETALNILDRAVEELEGEEKLQDLSTHLSSRAENVRKVVAFYQHNAAAAEANFLSQDTVGLIESQEALKVIGALEHGDWWNHLPKEELTAEQFDDLRQTVYRVLVSLTGIYTKQLGEKMLGDEGSVGRQGLFRALMGSAGKDEGRAALILSDMANRFRVAESIRWYRGRVARRFGRNYYVAPEDLRPPANSADARALFLLNLVAALNPEFHFADYRGEPDPLVSAHDMMQLALEMEPDFYWSSLSMGHTEYLLAKRAVEAGEPDAWRQYDAARQAFGRCIALQPELPFAYADTSTLCLHQAEALVADPSVSDEEVKRRTLDLHRLSLKHAERALDLAPNAAWVNWHLGQSLLAAGQTEKAVDAFLAGIERDHRLTPSTDSLLVDADDIRGRTRAINLGIRLSEEQPEEPRYHLLVAAGHFSSGDIEAAEGHLNVCLELPDPPAMAWALKGIMALDQEDFADAQSSFQRAVELDAESIWGMYGLSRCLEQEEKWEAGLTQYEQALTLAVTEDQHGACELGRCRMLLRLGRADEAWEAVQSAKQWQASCDLDDVAQLATALEADEFLARLETLPSMSADVILNAEHLDEVQTLPILNGGFELPFNRYWGNDGGLTWMNQNSCQSVASITTDEAFAGEQSLRINYGSAERRSEAFGQTTQTIPSEAETEYRISLRAKADGLSTRSLRIVIDDRWESPVIELPAGSYDWTEFSGRFVTSSADPAMKDPTLVETTARIISAGPGTVWLDEIEATKVID